MNTTGWKIYYFGG